MVLIEMPCFSSRAKYSVKVFQSAPGPSRDPSVKPSRGAADVLSPVMSSVTPCRTLLCAVPSVTSGISECVWRSINPGETTSPVASIVRVAERPASEPIDSTRPSRMPTSARTAAAPVPSRTSPPVISTSNGGSEDDVHETSAINNTTEAITRIVPPRR
jgi:hypothetical protein